VMEKIGKERGLISYATLADYGTNMALATANGATPVNPLLVRTEGAKFSDRIEHFHINKIFRPRVLLYVAVFSAMGLGLLTTLFMRDRLELNVLHDRNPQFVVLSDGSIRNGYTIKILNMVPQNRSMELSLEGLPGATMVSEPATQPEGRLISLEIGPDQTHPIKVFVTLPKAEARTGKSEFSFVLTDKTLDESDTYKAAFNAPEAKP
jgi:polyferredoxin